MNLLMSVFQVNKRVNSVLDALDEDYRIFGPEPDQPKNYKTPNGYKAIIRDDSSYDMVVSFDGSGHIGGFKDNPF